MIPTALQCCRSNQTYALRKDKYSMRQKCSTDEHYTNIRISVCNMTWWMILYHQNSSSFFPLTTLTGISLQCAVSYVYNLWRLLFPKNDLLQDEQLYGFSPVCSLTLTGISLQCAVSYGYEGCFFLKTIYYKMNSCMVSLQCAISHGIEGCVYL
jgi:hypothetical protein